MPQELINPNNVPVTYSLSGADTTYVSIDASTGAITLNENTPLGQNVVFRVVATSSETELYKQKSVYYDVNLYCEKPSAPISWPAATKNLDISSYSDLPYIYTPQALNNPRNLSITYSVDSSQVGINQNTGEITIPSGFPTGQKVTVNVGAQSQATAEFKSTYVSYKLNITVTQSVPDLYFSPESTTMSISYDNDLPVTLDFSQYLVNPGNVWVMYSLPNQQWWSYDWNAGTVTLDENKVAKGITYDVRVLAIEQQEPYRKPSFTMTLNVI